jgi:hypothetical protein
MRNYPRWSHLRHYDDVSDHDFGDAQSFFDILKVVLSFLCTNIF